GPVLALFLFSFSISGIFALYWRLLILLVLRAIGNKSLPLEFICFCTLARRIICQIQHAKPFVSKGSQSASENKILHFGSSIQSKRKGISPYFVFYIHVVNGIDPGKFFLLVPQFVHIIHVRDYLEFVIGFHLLLGIPPRFLHSCQR